MKWESQPIRPSRGSCCGFFFPRALRPERTDRRCSGISKCLFLDPTNVSKVFQHFGCVRDTYRCTCVSLSLWWHRNLSLARHHTPYVHTKQRSRVQQKKVICPTWLETWPVPVEGRREGGSKCISDLKTQFFVTRCGVCRVVLLFRHAQEHVLSNSLYAHLIHFQFVRVFSKITKILFRLSIQYEYQTTGKLSFELYLQVRTLKNFCAS